MKSIQLGIDRDKLANSVNMIFMGKAPEDENDPTVLEDYLAEHNLNVAIYNVIKAANPRQVSIQDYLLERGYVPLQDDVSLSDMQYNRYKVRRIESKFMPFINLFRSTFVFESNHLGWVDNISIEDLNTVVPASITDIENVTFREYCKYVYLIDESGELLLIDQNGTTDLSQYSNYKLYAELGHWSLYPEKAGDYINQDEFWLLYDYFTAKGYNILLDYEFDELTQPRLTIDSIIDPDAVIDEDQLFTETEINK